MIRELKDTQNYVSTILIISLAAVLFGLAFVFFGELFLCRMMLSLAGGVANGTEAAPLGRLLGEFRGLCDLLLAALAAVLAVFLLLLGVLCRLGIAVGGGT